MNEKFIFESLLSGKLKKDVVINLTLLHTTEVFWCDFNEIYEYYKKHLNILLVADYKTMDIFRYGE